MSRGAGVVLRRIGWNWGPAVSLMVLIFVMSSSPNPPRPPGGLPDVVVHALVYAALGAFVLRGLARAKMTNVTFGLAAVAVGIATLYGLSDELHQSFVPGRVSDVRDLVADGVGAIVGVTLVGAWSIVLSFRQPR